MAEAAPSSFTLVAVADVRLLLKRSAAAEMLLLLKRSAAAEMLLLLKHMRCC